MTCPRRVYLSGPMTGYPDYNYPIFRAAAAELRGRGFEVENPAEHFGGRQDLPYAAYMRADILALLDVRAVVVLPGWLDSRGARLEVRVADAIGLPVFLYPALTPVLLGRRDTVVEVASARVAA